MPKGKILVPPTRDSQNQLANPEPDVHSHEGGMPPQEIRTRLNLAGFSIPELATKMRRSPFFIQQVIHRERRSYHVETVIAKVLAWTGFTQLQVWGRLCETDDGEISDIPDHLGNGEAE